MPRFPGHCCWRASDTHPRGAALAAEQAQEMVLGKNVIVAGAFHSLSATVLDGDGDVDLMSSYAPTTSARGRWLRTWREDSRRTRDRWRQAGECSHCGVNDRVADHDEHPSQSAWSRVESYGAGNLGQWVVVSQGLGFGDRVWG